MPRGAVFGQSTPQQCTLRAANNWCFGQICFLGFGFDPDNMERLGLHYVMDWIAEKTQDKAMPAVMGSTYRMTPAEINSRFLAFTTRCGDVKWFDKQSLMALRHSGWLGDGFIGDVTHLRHEALYDKALSFVQEEWERLRSSHDSKLALRYSHLHLYFASHPPVRQ